MFRRTTRSTVLLGAALLLTPAACSDTTGVTGDPLTQSEAFSIFAELQSAVATALGSVTTAPPAADGGVLMTPLPEVTGACDGGGNVTLRGEFEDNIDPTTGIGTFTFDFLQSIDDCVVVTGATSFTVNGAPNLLISGDVTIDDTFLISGTYTMGGAFRYAADDERSGTCDVDVEIVLETRTTAGKVCGKDVGT